MTRGYEFMASTIVTKSGVGGTPWPNFLPRHNQSTRTPHTSNKPPSSGVLCRTLETGGQARPKGRHVTDFWTKVASDVTS